MLLALLGVLLTAATSLTSTGRGPRWVEFTVIVCNDDWASAGSNLTECLAAGFDLMFIQEGKRARYRDLRDRGGARLLPYSRYGVHQDSTSLARAGSVVIWLHTAFTRTGGGWTFGVKARGLLGRWIAWLRGRVQSRRMWVASAHWPPHRTARWQPAFSAALWARVHLARVARRLILIGTDSNQAGGPPRLPASLVWSSAVHGSIDGLIHSPAIRVISATELPKATSDHHPQRFVIRIPL